MRLIKAFLYNLLLLVLIFKCIFCPLYAVEATGYTSISAISNTFETAVFFFQKADFEKALDICDTLIEKNDLRRVDAYELKTRIYEQTKRFPEALTHYDRLLRMAITQLDRNEIRANMARIKALEMNDPRGLEELQKLSQAPLSKPLLTRVRYWYAGALLKQRKLPEAAVEFKRFIKDFPETVEIDLAKGYLVQCETSIKDQEARNQKHRVDLEARQKAAEAVKSAVKAPDRSVVLFQEAEALRKEGNYKDAAKKYEAIRFQGFGPNLDKALARLGGCRYALGDVPAAMEAWEGALKLPASPTNAAIRASCLMSLGSAYLNDLTDPVKAGKRFEELLARYPDSTNAVEASVKWAIALLYQDRPKEAERLLLAAQEKRGKPPEGPRDEIRRLLQICKGGQWGLLATLKDRKRNAEVERWLRLAELQFAAYDYKRAWKAYDQVVKLGPDGGEGGYALMQSARCWNQLGEHDKALSLYKLFKDEPYNTSPYADDALIRAGVIQVSYKNNLKAGAGLFRYVTENLQGGDMAPMAYFRLGTILMWQRDWAQSKEVYQAFIRLYPNNPCVPYIKNIRLKEIERCLAKKL
jgi:tetratricopeptide (TPR) repeat protein